MPNVYPKHHYFLHFPRIVECLSLCPQGLTCEDILWTSFNVGRHAELALARLRIVASLKMPCLVSSPDI